MFLARSVGLLTNQSKVHTRQNKYFKHIFELLQIFSIFYEFFNEFFK